MERGSGPVKHKEAGREMVYGVAVFFIILLSIGCSNEGVFENPDSIEVTTLHAIHGTRGHKVEFNIGLNKQRGESNRGEMKQSVLAIRDKEVSPHTIYLVLESVDIGIGRRIDLLREAQQVSVVSSLPEDVEPFTRLVLTLGGEGGDPYAGYLQITAPTGTAYLSLRGTITQEWKDWFLREVRKEPKVVYTVPTVIAGSAAVEDISHRPSVRLVYFRPKNYPARQGAAELLRTLIADANRYYADEMQRHGFGRKTFAVETDSNGVPVVHSIVGRFEEGYYRQNEKYSRGVYKAKGEILERYPDGPQHIYVCVMDMTENAFVRNSSGGCAFGGLHFAEGSRDRDALGGYVVIPASGSCSKSLPLMMHELGHSFGLHHDFREGVRSDLIMAYGNQSRLSKGAAEWLSVSAFFNNTAPHSAVGSITLLPNPRHTPQGIQISFHAEDADGLHQMQLLFREQTAYILIDFKTLNGGLTDTAEFTSTKLTQDKIIVQIIDKKGGITQMRFPPVN